MNLEVKLHLVTPRGVRKEDVAAALDRALANAGIQLHEGIPDVQGVPERVAGTVATFIGVCEVTSCEARAAIEQPSAIAKRVVRGERGAREAGGGRGAKGVAAPSRRIGGGAKKYFIQTWDNQDGVWEPNGSGTDLDLLIKRASKFVEHVDDVKIVDGDNVTVWSPPTE